MSDAQRDWMCWRDRTYVVLESYPWDCGKCGSPMKPVTFWRWYLMKLNKAFYR